MLAHWQMDSNTLYDCRLLRPSGDIGMGTSVSTSAFITGHSRQGMLVAGLRP